MPFPLFGLGYQGKNFREGVHPIPTGGSTKSGQEMVGLPQKMSRRRIWSSSPLLLQTLHDPNQTLAFLPLSFSFTTP